MGRPHFQHNGDITLFPNYFQKGKNFLGDGSSSWSAEVVQPLLRFQPLMTDFI
jgi:hypothetical protein